MISIASLKLHQFHGEYLMLLFHYFAGICWPIEYRKLILFLFNVENLLSDLPCRMSLKECVLIVIRCNE